MVSIGGGKNLKINIILFLSIFLNVVFALILLSLIYFGKKILEEINEHDKTINKVLQVETSREYDQLVI